MITLTMYLVDAFSFSISGPLLGIAAMSYLFGKVILSGTTCQHASITHIPVPSFPSSPCGKFGELVMDCCSEVILLRGAWLLLGSWRGLRSMSCVLIVIWLGLRFNLKTISLIPSVFLMELRRMDCAELAMSSIFPLPIFIIFISMLAVAPTRGRSWWHCGGSSSLLRRRTFCSRRYLEIHYVSLTGKRGRRA